jgi:hypothetical protein
MIWLVQGEQSYLFDQEGNEIDQGVGDLSTVVSEARTWQDVEERTWLGVCLPQKNAVFFNKVSPVSLRINFGWPTKGYTRLGTGAGQARGEFIFPLSFDVGPAGRIYVLDAGNARIQIFDAAGTYITHWGRKGSGAGEFDFGSGGLPEDFAGSVAVDDEGFIYVADMENRRIQKFEP